MSAAASKAKSRTYSLILVALFAALTAVLSQIAIPTPWEVPISLGNLAGFLAVGLLSWKEAVASQAVWVLLGVVGAPVFSRLGSFSRLVGPTGGYIIGYIVSALAAGAVLLWMSWKRRNAPADLYVQRAADGQGEKTDK